MAAVALLPTLLALIVARGDAFAPPGSNVGLSPLLRAPGPERASRRPSTSNLHRRRPHPRAGGKLRSGTALSNGVIIDVDDNFFTYAFCSMGLLYSLGKAYNRYLLEEVAFERRRDQHGDAVLERGDREPGRTKSRSDAATELGRRGRGPTSRLGMGILASPCGRAAE